MLRMGRLRPYFKQWAKLERLGRDKHGSLVGPCVNYGLKKFYKFSLPGVKLMKLFLFATDTLRSKLGVFVPSTLSMIVYNLHHSLLG